MTGASSGTPGSSPGTPGSSSAPPSTTPIAAFFQIRPVLALRRGSGPCATWTVPPARPGWFCNRDATARYRLAPAVLAGTDIASAEAGKPLNSTSWVVNLTLDPTGSRAFADLTGSVVDQPSPRNQLAFVLNGTVLSAPVVESRIRGGQLQLSGPLTRTEAEQLATQLTP
jgi:preprotein translocase subunit SecD